MRLDLAIPGAGERRRPADRWSSRRSVDARHLHRTGEASPPRFRAPSLAPHVLPEPDLANARRSPHLLLQHRARCPILIVLPDGRSTIHRQSMLVGRTFWAINRQSWPGTERGPAAAAGDAELGLPTSFELRTRRRFPPVAHSPASAAKFSNARGSPRPGAARRHPSCTTKERILLAFVRQPRRLMVRCHILEHHETG